MIRDPLDRAISHLNHFQTVNQRDDLRDYTIDTLLSQLDVDEGMPHNVTEAAGYIRDFSFYYEKIARYVDVFGEDNVFVVHNDDLKHNSAAVMRSLYEFLGLELEDDGEYTEQAYVTGTSQKKLPQSFVIKAYENYGLDYYKTCFDPDFRRPSSDTSGVYLNTPVGARVGEVAIAGGGELFLVGGSNSPLGMFTIDESEREKIVEAWIDRALERSGNLGDRGVSYLQCMIPEKLSILGDRLGWQLDLTKSFGSEFVRVSNQRALNFSVDLFSMFRSSPFIDSLYFKTDSHWNHVGAFAGYQMICHKLGVPFCQELLSRPQTSGPTLFDLGSKLPWPKKEEGAFVQFRQEAELVEEGDLVRYKRSTGRENDGGLHVGSFVRFQRKDAPYPHRVLLFGDSFSEYRDHLLSGLLAETFSELSFAWTTSIDYSLVDRLQPDVVICAMTERFMWKTPDDAFDLDSFARRRVASAQAQDT